MTRTLLMVTCGVFGAGTAITGARAAPVVRVADGLQPFLNSVLASCAPATEVRAGTGGCPAPEPLVPPGGQNLCLEGRHPSPELACTSPDTAEGLVVALDGISMVGSSTTAGACAGGMAHSSTRAFEVRDQAGQPVIDCPGCEPGTNLYRLRDWRDVLALVYGGVHHDGGRDCGSHVRRALVNSWGNLFEGACPAGVCPAGLQRAYRRADLSGTTATFVSLVGLRSMPLAATAPGAVADEIDFCNAFGAGAIFGGDSDFLDNDPIRRFCLSNEQVCGRLGHLGLVTVIEPPTNLTSAQNYPPTPCGFGQFRMLAPAVFGYDGLCPNGKPKLFNKCYLPVLVGPDGVSFTSDCRSRRFPVQGLGGGMDIPDGRGYNLTSRNADGSYRKDNLGRFITGAFYRLHTTVTVAAGASTCQRASATEQIGCLTQANPCSIGYAGREAGAVAGVTGLQVNGLSPTIANIENLVTTPSTADDYPLARKIDLKVLVGFESPNLATGDYDIAKCFGRSSLVVPAASAHGLVPVPGGVLCEDFDSPVCPAPNACFNNPPDLITP